MTEDPRLDAVDDGHPQRHAYDRRKAWITQSIVPSSPDDRRHRRGVDVSHRVAAAAAGRVHLRAYPLFVILRLLAFVYVAAFWILVRQLLLLLELPWSSAPVAHSRRGPSPALGAEAYLRIRHPLLARRLDSALQALAWWAGTVVPGASQESPTPSSSSRFGCSTCRSSTSGRSSRLRLGDSGCSRPLSRRLPCVLGAARDRCRPSRRPRSSCGFCAGSFSAS